MALTVVFLEADEFTLAWVDYGLNDAGLSLLKRNLTKNPFRGVPAKGDSAIRDYEFRRFVVRYAIKDPSGASHATIWLLDVVPAKEAASSLGKAVNAALKGVGWLVRLSRGNIGSSDDE